ncbi:Serine/threonine-protein phosphatase 2A 56 kDa regulatory subunit delta isoform [Hondaea fermentalgiana]|uniref:Serine/threonine protein phosphatase 2A regulatory subunit n=1 Tax=Hondaea fermentalgiana TaxID=2315210 RepID=A0A2R5G689_9STRA|nr:Serine/threonine-protein phosphatase 2A 56 kDa regulatory subunit delta isoform [Hondaea fermentalgiana]|eukprot:GBG25298.1 Serine/threonine-protein phosphatase 2A 56 kDa regulatory subunit delta isoform [Hondaea fermentalgiana]
MFGGFRKKDKNKASRQAAAAAAAANSSSNSSSSSSASGNGASGSSGNNSGGGSQGPAGSAGANGSGAAGDDRFAGLTLLSAMSLKDVSPSEQPRLFVRHLKLCHETFDFQELTHLKEKEAKRLLLLGLVDYLNNPNTHVHEYMFPDIISMVSANLFRALPPRNDLWGDEEDEPMMELAWPHLQIVYEFLLRFVVSGDVEPKPAKKYISHAFVLQLLGLFNSEDLRERDYLKTILHRIYGKFMALRAFIRKAIANIFLGCIYFGDHHNGIAELLEILGSIINGFALPLKAEHKRFLNTSLIPLHKVQGLATFQQQLEYCVTQFVEKDNKMAEPVVRGLLRYWPEVNSPKQCQFLHELEEILELIQLQEFRVIMVPLFRRIAQCLDSQHFQVAERTLLLWNNDYLFTLVTQNRREILPLVFDVLKRNADEHWNSNVQTLSQNVLKAFQDTDKQFYDEVQCASKAASEKRADAAVERSQLWDAICNQVAVASPSSSSSATASVASASSTYGAAGASQSNAAAPPRAP